MFIMSKNRPPCLDSTTICSLLKRLYPFKSVDKSSVKQLQGYEDRNFYFRGLTDLAHDGSVTSTSDSAIEEFILKVSHITNSSELLEGVNEVMDHLHHKGFRCSHAIRNHSGKKIALLSENQLVRGDPNARTGRCVKYPIRVLVYVPGETLEAVSLTPKLAFGIGELAGSINKALLVTYGCHTYIIVPVADGSNNTPYT